MARASPSMAGHAYRHYEPALFANGAKNAAPTEFGLAPPGDRVRIARTGSGNSRKEPAFFANGAKDAAPRKECGTPGLI